jgi:hypothetical protein
LAGPRHQLLALGDAALKDFGRNRADALHEGRQAVLARLILPGAWPKEP